MTKSPTAAAARPPFDAVIFDLDGVVTNTALVHQKAWGDVFNSIISDPRCPESANRSPFTKADYLNTVDGKPRESGMIDLLASRGVALELGLPTDGPGEWTAYGLGELKNRFYLDRLATLGVKTYPGTRQQLERLRAEGIPAALVTSSRNAAPVLAAAGLTDAFKVVVDGTLALELGLSGKPAPDVFLEAAHLLQVAPDHAVVIEDSAAGVKAAQLGGFGRVVGIDRAGSRRALEAAGAHEVLNDVSELDLGLVLGDPWNLVYRGTEPDHEGHREALTTLGNGYLGVRGASSGYTPSRYAGMYLAGVYNRVPSSRGSHPTESEHLVNAPDCLFFDLRLSEGSWWSTGGLRIIDERTTLDLNQAVLERQLDLESTNSKRLSLVERRFVSMAEPHLIVIETRVSPVGWSGAVRLRTGVNAGVRNANVPGPPVEGQTHLIDQTVEVDQAALFSRVSVVEVETVHSKIHIAVAFESVISDRPGVPGRQGLRHFRTFKVSLVDSEPVTLTKIIAVVTSRDRAISTPRIEAQAVLARAGTDVANLQSKHREAWQRLLGPFRVDIDAPAQVRMILNLHLFHLLQTLTRHTAELDAGVPARGLHGEGYRGLIFWDELFVLPVLTLRTPDIARALLEYRWRRLPAARQAAAVEGLSGAKFPWQSGSDGSEETPQWLYNERSGRWIRDHSHLQRHVGLSVAFNAWQYYVATMDKSWLFQRGADLIVEVSRFFAARVVHDPSDGRHHLRGIMGPDEYHSAYPGKPEPGIDDNAYTNVMASWVFGHAAAVCQTFEGHEFRLLTDRLGITAEEVADWVRLSTTMFVPFHSDGVISQFDGYEALRELDWEKYRETYDNIERLDLILEAEDDDVNRYKLAKQADVLMLPYLLGADGLVAQMNTLGYTLTKTQLSRTIDYYLERTAHGSTLSRVVHASVLAAITPDRAWDSFREALDADLDDTQHGTTKAGIHLGAMAGTVDVVQRSFAGLRLRSDRLVFAPSMPAGVAGISFNLLYRGHQLAIELRDGHLGIVSSPGSAPPVKVEVGSQSVLLLAGSEKVFRLPDSSTSIR